MLVLCNVMIHNPAILSHPEEDGFPFEFGWSQDVVAVGLDM